MKEVLKSILALTVAALTSGGGEIPPELQAEIDAITAAIEAMPEEGATQPVDQTETVAEITNKINDLAGKIKNSAETALILNKTMQAKMIVVDQAMKAYNATQKDLAKGAGRVVNCDFNALAKNNGALRFVNANNTTFRKSSEEEFTIDSVLRQTGLLTGLKEMPIEPGANTIFWTEGTKGANVAAIVAIGSDTPAKTNTTATHTKATDTLGEMTTVPVQLLRAINGVQQIYQDDLRGDLEDKVALQVAALLATANNPINVTTTVNVGTANVADVIECAYLQLKPRAMGNRIAVAISSEQEKALVLLRDTIGRKLDPVIYADLDIVTFIADNTYTDDKIFAWVENHSIRNYNDGLQISTDELNGNGVSGDNFKKNQISLKAQYLNQAMVIRGTDVLTTIYDSISGVITELTAGA